MSCQKLKKLSVKLNRENSSFLELKEEITEIDAISVRCQETAFETIRQCFDSDTIEYKETFVCLYMNNSAQPLGYSIISEGGLTGALVDGRSIFAVALLTGASNIILSHNHPSGVLKPSRSDESLTLEIERQGKTMDIHIKDHIIISREKYYSFMQEGKLNYGK